MAEDRRSNFAEDMWTKAAAQVVCYFSPSMTDQ